MIRRVDIPLRAVLWLGFFAIVLLAWWVMYDMARMSGLNVWGVPVGMNMMPMESFGALFAMWAIMMAAMMLPTMVPTLMTYETLIRTADGSRAGWLGVLGGYFVAWIGFAAGIALLQVVLFRAGLVDILGIATSGLLSAALLIAVGLFQFTRLKEVCHGVCHAPMHYFLGHWKTGLGGGFRMGLGLGGFCVVCCWGFMALGFVGGTMSLLWMGLATFVMVLEKLPQVAHYVIKPVGVVLILGGLVVALISIGIVG